MTCSFSNEFSPVAYTDVENAFITEYLPLSPGDAVKVYLYGLFLCRHPERDQGIESLCKILNMTIDEVKSAFTYWEDFGLLSVIDGSTFSVIYHPVRQTTGGKPRKIKAEKYTDFAKILQLLITQRMISTNEYSEYFTVMETYAISPEAMLMIVKYCIDKKGADISYRYVLKVAKDFGGRGIVTVEAVEKELASYVAKSAVLERILKAMNIRRQPDIEDAEYFKKWTEELSFDAEAVLYAAKKLKKGSMAKLDDFLLQLYSMKSFSPEEIEQFISKKEAVYDLAIKINKALSVYVDVLDTVVDNYTTKWLSYGFESEALVFIASHCFKTGKNTLQDMDELVEKLHEVGVITLSSVGDYFENEKKSDEFISKLLMTVGVTRRPNPWDRQNLTLWKSWGFTEDMILEAGKLSAGKNSPLAYVNGVLSNWKNNNVFSLETVSSTAVSPAESQQEYNREYARRRRKALAVAQKNNEIAMSIEGFAELYGKINGMERDLAIASIGGNEKTLKELETKQRELIEKAESLLKTANLTMRDLSPVYACEKCNDTGYVGTNKCDCYNKKVL